MNPDPVTIAEVLKMFGGASATAILGAVLFYVVRYTIPGLQKTFEDAIAKRDERDQYVRAQHDALHTKIVDALLELKKDK